MHEIINYSTSSPFESGKSGKEEEFEYNNNLNISRTKRAF